MERIKGYNIEVYVGIIRGRIELHQILKMDKKSEKLSITQSAEKGYIELLIYLHERGCKWDKWTSVQAACAGQTKCLRYLHEKGCEWDGWTLARCKRHVHLQQ